MDMDHVQTDRKSIDPVYNLFLLGISTQTPFHSDNWPNSCFASSQTRLDINAKCDHVLARIFAIQFLGMCIHLF